jgi:prepilin-type N-terminal cleavage/methylation domain-containing protein/prepilin-type processing-associated H-X9-DG protein
MASSRSRRAFTLVEILVVLAIVGILAALLFPVFARVRENGRKTVCLSNIHQVMTALALYTQDSNGQYPCVADVGAASQFHLSSVAKSWTEPMSSYVASSEVLHCPSDTSWGQRQSEVATLSSSSLPSSYLWNLRCLSNETVDRSSSLWKPVILAVSEKDVVLPTSTVLLCDGVQNAWPDAPYTQDYPQDLAVTSQVKRGDILGDASKGGGSSCCDSHNPAGCVCDSVFAPVARHLGRANVAFADGHVKSLSNASWYFPNTPWLDPKRGG